MWNYERFDTISEVKLSGLFKRKKKTIEAAALLSICAVSGFDGSLLKLVRRLLFQ